MSSLLCVSNLLIYSSHTGDLTKFPPHVEVVLGPGSTSDYDALAEELFIPVSTLKERKVTILNDKDYRWQKVGSFWAVDWLGNGSFWLLHSSGHTQGHISGLARISNEGDGKWILLGADTCHHASTF